MIRILLGIIVSLAMSVSFAGKIAEPLPADQAFVFTSYIDQNGRVIFLWDIAPGYYLYQNKLQISLSPTGFVKPSSIEWPKNQIVKDAFGESHNAYTGSMKVVMPMLATFKGPLKITINYQGCSLNGFCYTPMKKFVDLTSLTPGKQLQISNLVTLKVNHDAATRTSIERLLDGDDLFLMMLSFLGLGLLLAFTPCVWPLFPILSTIIIGQKKPISTLHAVCLSFSYVFGMALTYAAAGMLVAYAGQSVQVILEKPWVIVLFSGLFMLLALSLFGFFDLRLPGRWQRHISEISSKQKSGTYAGVFLMGCLSTLIVSPCVSPPLVGVLAYIAQTGNVWLGASALLVLGFGMGIPLLLMGASAGKWLPKSGPWMDLIRKWLSLFMLGVAFSMLSRVIPGPSTLMIWSVLVSLFGIYCIFLYPQENLKTGLRMFTGIVAIAYGVLMFVNAEMGNMDPLRPWEGVRLAMAGVENHALDFESVQNQARLDEEFQEAKDYRHFVMLDFYAQWCVSCIYIDKTVFSRKDVGFALKGFDLLRIDVTENNAFDQAVMRKFNVIAPPAILFFDPAGKELLNSRIIGETDAKNLIEKIKLTKE